MKFGVIGLNFGANYVKNLDALGQDIVICAKNWSKHIDLLVKYDSEADWLELCNDETIDAIVVATPPDLHYEICLLALLKGKHVICEKPFVFENWQAKTLKEVALKVGKNLVVDYIHLWNSDYINFKKKLVNKNEFSISNLGNGPFRDYSDLWDYGSHSISLAHDLIGPPSELSHVGTFSGIKLINYKNDIGDLDCYFSNSVKRAKTSIVEHSKCFEWIDSRKNNPLKSLLLEFIEKRNQQFNNLDLAISVTQTLNLLEHAITIT